MPFIKRAIVMLFIGTLFLVSLSGCMTATIYTTPEFDTLQFSHDIVAILPFDVTFNAGHQDRSVEEISNLEIQIGKDFQRALYTQFLQQQKKNRYSIKFQDIDDTNAMLNRNLDAPLTIDALSSLTKSEICEILNVDALISGNLSLSKPMGAGAAIASSLLIGVGGVTNKARITMTIHDRENGQLLWSYEHRAKGGLLSSPEGVADSLMKGIAKKFPYENK